MTRIFFLIFLPLLVFGQETAAYFNLDNRTIADVANLATDPFLILRTKSGARDEKHSIEESCKALVGHPDTQENGLILEENVIRVAVENPTTMFHHETPYFILNCEEAEKIWWQIADEPNFENVIPNLDQIEAFTSRVTLDAIAETFLNPCEPYYFRARAIVENTIGPWSEVFTFMVDKPKQIQKPEFTKIAKGHYEISWAKNDSESTEYLIFASNSQDFIPSIYCDKHLLGISTEGQIETVPNYNLVAITPSNRIEIDGSLAYYRIIAIDHGQLSVPSELIYVYDNDLWQDRNRLVFLEDHGIQRKRYHSSNPYSFATNVLKDYASNPYISAETWARVNPYLMPANHPAMPILDLLFGSKRISQSVASLQEAGFKTRGSANNHSQTIFCQHKKLKGFVVKLIPDEFRADEVTRLVTRITGAQTARDIIEKYGYHKLFKVPRKWLYVLPPEPSPAPDMIRKNFILVAEDMNIYSREENYPIWKSFFMTPERLHAIYTVITEGGFNDCVYAFNLPFSKDGKIAFVDTEDHHKWPIPYKLLTKYLSPEMQIYWEQLTNVN